MYEVSGSIVAYRNSPAEIRLAIESFLNTRLEVRLYVVDNSPTDSIRDVCRDDRVVYLFNGRNLGFGAAHNRALRLSAGDAPYHVVLNPDVYFGPGVLEVLVGFAREHPHVGLLMPKVLNPDGTLQYLCKRLPSPADLALRRFVPDQLKPIFRRRLMDYELRNQDYSKMMSVPALSGCFMMLNSGALAAVGGFDERYFMYLEDVDLCRRIGQRFETIYYPDVSVYHGYAKGSYRSLRLLMRHVVSAVRYFQKWGWLSDSERVRVNERRLGRACSLSICEPPEEDLSV